MEKLELKHLAPYLPYELKMSENKYDLVLNVNNHPNHCYDLEYSIKEQIKPILRPLSDLKKIKDKIEKLSPYWYVDDETKWLTEKGKIDKIYPKHVIEWIPYVLMELLLENHYDVFGLIDKGLAIDINTLQNK